MTPWAELFPDEDFRFHLTLQHAEVAEFFRPRDSSGTVLNERRRWLQESPARYSAEGDANPRLAAAWGEWVQELGFASAGRCAELGGLLEPDFLLLAPDADGAFRLQAGALVFPTSWALEEKLGRTMDEIHGVVPGLNSTLAPSINRFLARLRPGGPAFRRWNWGLAATDALNLHPSRPRPRLDADRPLAQIWVRVEEQLLAALPAGCGIVFGIRVGLTPLESALQEPGFTPGFDRALRSMPDEVLVYKGLAEIRPRLIAASRD